MGGQQWVFSHRQRFIIDLHQVQCVIRRVMVVSYDKGYRLADVTYLVPGQGGMARYLHPFHLGYFTMGNVVHRRRYVLPGNHYDHTRHVSCVCHVDGPDVGVGLGAADENSVRHVRHSHVVQIGAATGHQPEVLESLKGLSHVGHSKPPGARVADIDIPR